MSITIKPKDTPLRSSGVYIIMDKNKQPIDLVENIDDATEIVESIKGATIWAKRADNGDMELIFPIA